MWKNDRGRSFKGNNVEREIIIMPTNWKKLYTMKKKAERELLEHYPFLNNESGIYILTRYENGVRFAYIGLAKRLLDRLISHMIGYSQRIDISLRKRGFYKPKENECGWDLMFYNYSEEELNNKEQEFIREYLNRGYQMYNKTLGSQGEGKISIDDHSTKGYYDGVAYGYKKAIKEVAEYFEKYLDYDIKPTLVKKDGTRTAISLKKYDEFAQLLKGDKENE